MKISTFQLTHSFFILTSIVLVGLGIGTLFRISGNPDRVALYSVYALLFFGDAAAMLLCAFLMKKRTKLVFFFSVLVLVLNILPTIFDQFGLVDLLFLLLNLITLIVLVMARKEFLPA